MTSNFKPSALTQLAQVKKKATAPKRAAIKVVTTCK